MSTRNGYAKDVRIITTGIKQNESIMCESALGRKWPGAFVLRMRGGDPMLSMLEWFCEQMMEAEVPIKLNADKSERSDGRSSYRYGYCPIRLDIRLGTIYLMDPKVR